MHQFESANNTFAIEVEGVAHLQYRSNEFYESQASYKYINKATEL